MQWYYEIGGVKQGPCDIETIQQLLDKGTLTGNNHVWNRSMGHQWTLIADVPELSDHKLKVSKALGASEVHRLHSTTVTAAASEEQVLADGQRLEYLRGLINKRLEDGATKRRIRHELTQKRVPEKLAYDLISEVSASRQARYRGEGILHIIVGILAIASGVVLTVFFSYLTERFGFGILFYGLILGGALEILNGLRLLIFGAAKRIIWIPIVVIVIIVGGILLLRHYNML